MNFNTLTFLIALSCVFAHGIKARSATSDEDRLYREQYAKKMISYMNPNIDPCDDFYEYACGNWKNTHKKRRTDKRRDNLFDIDFDLADTAAVLIQNPDENLNVKYKDEIQQARIFHESCLQANLFPAKKSNEYLKVIQNISGFPAIDDNWKAKNFDWFDTNARYSVYGVKSFVNEDILPVYPFVAYFKMPELGFDMKVQSDNMKDKATRGYVLNKQRMQQYLMTYGVVALKADEVVDSIFELWQAILNVSDEFNGDMEKCVELGKSKDNKWPKWQSYLDIVWGSGFSNSYSECPCAYFYMKLDEICRERKEAVANYLALKFLHQMEARLEHHEVKYDYCNQKLLKTFKFLMDELYMAQRDLTNEKRDIDLLTTQIRAIFREKLKELEWLDDETRMEAQRKESTITFIIGRVEEPEIMDQLIKEIKKLRMERANFEKNNLAAVKFQAYMERYFGLNYEDLGGNIKPPDFYTAMQSQALYYQVDVMIYIMAGILNPPAYHKSWPWALKFSTLGYALGHELTHAFDTTGADIDSTGTQERWWTPNSFATFENFTQCFIDKFNEYEIQEIHRNVNGNLTKDENIADNGGLRYAFKAYQRHIKEQRADNEAMKEEQMPGLDLKPEQLFYLGFAQVWCADYKEENIWQELEDAHAYEKYRVIGALSLLPEFAEAYKCPAGSRMNPTDKRCKMW